MAGAGRGIRHVCVIGAALSVLLWLAVGCGSGDNKSLQADLDPFINGLMPTTMADVADGQTGVSPVIPITATAHHGSFTLVGLVGPNNVPVAGQLSPDGSSWHTTSPLAFHRTYRLRMDATGLAGTTSRVVSFTTLAPANLTDPYPIVSDHEVVGIGQPVAIQFDENIPDRMAVQNAINVTTDPPVPGAFYWISRRDLRWRPAKFWAPGTRVTVDANLYGRNLGNGLYGGKDVHETFTIGDAVIFTADDNTHHVVVSRNGVVIRDMPTSMGKSSTPTQNGVYLVGGRYKEIIMDSASFGVPSNSPGGYRVPVEWATQLAYNGVYLHSAPWSVGAQGWSDTSHGCLNLSPSNAEWTYYHTKRGDITIVKNSSGGVLSGTDGLGDWNVPWPVWQAGNAATP